MVQKNTPSLGRRQHYCTLYVRWFFHAAFSSRLFFSFFFFLLCRGRLSPARRIDGLVGFAHPSREQEPCRRPGAATATARGLPAVVSVRRPDPQRSEIDGCGAMCSAVWAVRPTLLPSRLFALPLSRPPMMLSNHGYQHVLTLSVFCRSHPCSGPS